MKKQPNEKIWMLIHGELSEEEEEEAFSEIASDEERVQVFQARNELDLILGEAFSEPEMPQVGFRAPEQHAEARNGGRYVVFPTWGRLVQVAAVVAILLCLIGLLLPRGDLEWGRTQVALLDRGRGPQEPVESMLDVPSAKRACQALQRSIDETYQSPQDAKPTRWTLRLHISEHARGALLVRVEGTISHRDGYLLLDERRYDDVHAFEADINGLTESVIMAIHQFTP